MTGATPPFVAISEFPKGRKYLISLSFLGKSSVRPAQVGRFDVNIVIHGSTAVRGRGDLVAYGWALWKLPAPWPHRTRPPHLGKRCAFSTSFHRAFPIKSSDGKPRQNPERPQNSVGKPGVDPKKPAADKPRWNQDRLSSRSLPPRSKRRSTQGVAPWQKPCPPYLAPAQTGECGAVCQRSPDVAADSAARSSVAGCRSRCDGKGLTTSP